MCNFENDIVKSDCPMQENNEILKDLIQTVGLLYKFNCLFWKKTLKMTSQLVNFRAFFSFFFRPPDPKSEKKFP